MKIAVLGAGAMGGLYSAYLSKQHEVCVIDANAALVEKLCCDGLSLQETDGSVNVYRSDATTDTSGRTPVDLVILFVKAMYSEAALRSNRGIIGKDTYLLTLQNGSGHEEVLSKFVDSAHIIIGSTQHNAAILGLGSIRHGGSGETFIGSLSGAGNRLQGIADAFSGCGLPCTVSDNVQKIIWNKLFTNVTVSALTGALQVPMGFIGSDACAWAACCALLREAIAVAAGMGMDFSYDEKCAELKALCEKSPGGLTSIYADIRDGRRTEVDTISGSITRAGDKCGVDTPSHKLLIHLIHAMESKAAQK